MSSALLSSTAAASRGSPNTINRITDIAMLLYSAVLLGTNRTVDPRTATYASLPHGYLVSIQRFGRCFDGTPNIADIREWLDDIAQDMAVHEEPLYLGVWRHPVTGAFCFDANLLIETFANAIERGIEESQHSIFDNAGRQPVPVPVMAVSTNGEMAS